MHSPSILNWRVTALGDGVIVSAQRRCLLLICYEEETWFVIRKLRLICYEEVTNFQQRIRNSSSHTSVTKNPKHYLYCSVSLTILCSIFQICCFWFFSKIHPLQWGPLPYYVYCTIVCSFHSVLVSWMKSGFKSYTNHIEDFGPWHFYKLKTTERDVFHALDLQWVISSVWGGAY